MNLSETAEVLGALTSTSSVRDDMALATIVAVRGSTYRRPGARLLVSRDGDMVGNLSGGCLEGEVQHAAEEVMTTARPRLVSYDLTADDEVVWGWGLGCNGAIDVFIEPAANAVDAASAMRAAIEEQRVIGVATVLESSAPGVETGRRLIVDPRGRSKGTLGGSAADDAAHKALLDAMSRGATEIVSIAVPDGEARVFVEVLEPPLRLVVCGAGHDAIPVVRLASSLGWHTVVVDDREAFLDRARFPEARELVKAQALDAAAAVRPDGHTYVVVMSHNFLRDQDYLRAFAASDAAYIGMLGPRARLERLLDALRSDGVILRDDDVRRIHGPAGLDLGAEGPDEIAAAIVAEVLSVSRGRAGGFLKDRAAPIHDRRDAVRAS